MNDTTVAKSKAHEHENLTENWLHKYHSTSSSLSNSDENHEGIATRLYFLCLWSLQQVYRQEKARPQVEERISRLKEELGRFHLWGEALGDGTLDKAIEYSDDLRCDVLDSLGEIARLLRNALRSSSLTHQRQGSQDPSHELDYLLEQIKVITSSKINIWGGGTLEEDDGSGTDRGDESEDDENDDILEGLELHISCLTQLVPIIEQNWIKVQNPPVPAPPPSFFVSGPAEIYVSLVREKYKYAQNELIERLGEANWQRHLNVRKRMEASGSSPQEARAVEELSEAKSVFRPYSAFHDSGIGTSIAALTEYAPSHTSFQSSNSECEGGAVRVPATPVEVHDGRSFQCFLCKRMLSGIKTRVDWKIHIFSDLRPYICTFSDCDSRLAQFDRRAAWAEHEFTQHRNLPCWICPECPRTFSEVSDWNLHLQRCHNLTFAGSHLRIAQAMAFKTHEGLIEEEECPLCRTIVGKPRRGFVKHVGRHMEEIALMALPRDVNEDTDEASERSDHKSVVSETIASEFLAPDIPRQSNERRFSDSQDSIQANNTRRSLQARLGIKIRDRYGRTLLAQACTDGTAKVEHLIKKYPQAIDRPDNAGNTPLHIASSAGDVKTVQLLINAGCCIDPQNIGSDTPLIDAVRNSHVEVVKLLLQAGADPHSENSKGQAPIELIDTTDKYGKEVTDLLIRARSASSIRLRTQDSYPSLTDIHAAYNMSGHNSRISIKQSDREGPSTPENRSLKSSPPDSPFIDFKEIEEEYGKVFEGRIGQAPQLASDSRGSDEEALQNTARQGNSREQPLERQGLGSSSRDPPAIADELGDPASSSKGSGTSQITSLSVPYIPGDHHCQTDPTDLEENREESHGMRKRGSWGPEEDSLLMMLVDIHGNDWVKISGSLVTRSPKQCRERFRQHLDPALNHAPFTPEEGEKIEKMVAAIGKRWSEIARQLPGRSENAVKGWWHGAKQRRQGSIEERANPGDKSIVEPG